MVWTPSMKRSQQWKGGLDAKRNSVFISPSSLLKTFTTPWTVKFQKASLYVSHSGCFRHRYTCVGERVAAQGAAITLQISNTHRGHGAVAWSSSAVTLQISVIPKELLFSPVRTTWRSLEPIILFKEKICPHILSFLQRKHHCIIINLKDLERIPTVRRSRCSAHFLVSLERPHEWQVHCNSCLWHWSTPTA